MRGVFARDGGVVVGKRSGDQFKMRTVKDKIRLFGILVHRQSEIAGIHIEGLVDFAHELIRTEKRICLQHAHKLAGRAAHDLEPCHILPGLFTI